jgi:SAM-dependent methyltransferase
MAGVYDRFYEPVDVEVRMDLLEELAAGGRALELGIGTGEFALPLAARGVEVHGIDISEAMVEQLRAKEGGARLPVTIGNFADVEVEGKFSLIYVLNNTLFMLTEQEEQVRCFANAAARLGESGVLLVDAFVPDVTRFDRGQEVRARLPDLETVRLDVSTHDPMEQLVDFRHVLVREDGIQVFPARLRYIWPSEMDLMARLAGFRLRERWGDWRRGRFTSTSGAHVSVYERA